ncbi:hypothetical protein CFP56_012805 [Quercus suber]|uniref:Uncharacterized protein n=1 Tax=Quercus suber TaxID=58331 RepID=A0AAW0KVE0_QUESU
MADKIVNHSDDDKEGSDDTLTDSHGKVDAMIQANVMGFAEPAEEQWRVFDNPLFQAWLSKGASDQKAISLYITCSLL